MKIAAPFPKPCVLDMWEAGNISKTKTESCGEFAGCEHDVTKSTRQDMLSSSALSRSRQVLKGRGSGEEMHEWLPN